MRSKIMKIAGDLGWHTELLTSTDIIIFNDICPEYAIPVTIDSVHNTIAARVILADELYMILISKMRRHQGIGMVAVYNDNVRSLGYVNTHDYSFDEFSRAFSNFNDHIKKEA